MGKIFMGVNFLNRSQVQHSTQLSDIGKQSVIGQSGTNNVMTIITEQVSNPAFFYPFLQRYITYTHSLEFTL